MGKKENKSLSVVIPVVATIFAAAAVLIVSVTFNGPGFGQLWPLIGLVLFSSLAFTVFMTDKAASWPIHIFLSTLFLFWLLSNTAVLSMKKSWPFLVLIAGILVVMTFMVAKKNKK